MGKRKALRWLSNHNPTLANYYGDKSKSSSSKFKRQRRKKLSKYKPQSTLSSLIGKITDGQWAEIQW